MLMFESELRSISGWWEEGADSSIPTHSFPEPDICATDQAIYRYTIT
jgi:hypothetical protein